MIDNKPVGWGGWGDKNFLKKRGWRDAASFLCRFLSVGNCADILVVSGPLVVSGQPVLVAWGGGLETDRVAVTVNVNELRLALCELAKPPRAKGTLCPPKAL